MVGESLAIKPIMSLTRPSCAQMFFIYAGRANMAMNFLDLVRNTGLSDRNLVLVRDLHSANYERGVSPDIPDLESLVCWHEEHLQKHPRVSDVYCIGNSSGCYGAILFGYMMGAKRVYAFAPRTAQLSTAPKAKAFLRELISTGNGVTEYLIHFAPSNERDRAFAEYLADSPGVALRPYSLSIPGRSDHAVMSSMVETGEMRDLMPDYLAAEPESLAARA